MVDFKRITDTAKDLVDKRGGTDRLKEDAAELRNIAKGPGSFQDKAKAAVDAIKDPGGASATQSSATPPQATTPAGEERAEGKVEGEDRGKHGGGGGHGHGRHPRHRGQGGGDGDPAV